MKRIVLFSLALFASIPLFGQPSDWAQYGRYEKQNAALAGKPIEAVFMGNSIIDNWIAADPAFFEKNGFEDRGISGQTTSQMLARLRRDVLELRPRAMVLLAGINDIAQNNGPITIENSFGNIVSMCELATCHGIRVVLCSLLPCDRCSWRPEIRPAGKVVALNSLLKEYAAANGMVYVDYHAAFDNGRGGLPESFSSDGCHPTPEGYTRMEPMVVKAIAEALGCPNTYYVTPVSNQ